MHHDVLLFVLGCSPLIYTDIIPQALHNVNIFAHKILHKHCAIILCKMYIAQYLSMWYNIGWVVIDLEKVKFDKIAYNNRFIAQSYDRINLTVPKGDRKTIKEHADEFDGGSVNGFIQRAIKETMQRDMMRVKSGGN